jgi:hypothetical protein
MAITFDGETKRITLDSSNVSAQKIWSDWVNWHQNNSEWPLAFRQVGGDSLGSGLYIPPYFFLLNNWRVRPMESSHDLVITGNLFVEGGGVPVVRTIGTYQVNTNYTVPVQAQGISTGGGSSLTAEQIRDVVLDALLYNYTITGSLGNTISKIYTITKSDYLNNL